VQGPITASSTTLADFCVHGIPKSLYTADPKGEGARTCLTIYTQVAGSAAEAAAVIACAAPYREMLLRWFGDDTENQPMSSV
jgi:hypothetical protein